MGLEDITKRIIDDAEEQAKQIKKQAEDSAKEFIKVAEEEVKVSKAESLAVAEREAANEKKRLLALARLEARKIILGKKQEAIEAAFEKTKALLASLPQDRYRKFLLERLLKEATGQEEIIVASRDKDYFTTAFLDEVNSKLQKMGKSGNLKLSDEKRDIEGGFVLKLGGIEVDSSLDAVVNSSREELEEEVIKILFGS